MSISKQRGGRREGAGRPKGSGKFKEATQSIRIPLPLKPQIDDLLSLFIAEKQNKQILLPDQESNKKEAPLFLGRIRAGFLSETSDYIDEKINLHTHLVRHDTTTFFVKVHGDSMCGAYIHEGDLLVVDRALPPKTGDIVIAVIDGELTVKRLSIEGKKITLLAENPNYPPIPVHEEQEMRIWGVVTFVIHQLKNQVLPKTALQ